jgi:alkanesulfonate monooxygenase SsuD/methylene tetrahydromethanopterin reductase-like flavin-dependent oxidoreductase (luciferase family)
MQVGLQFFPSVTPAEKSAATYFDECLTLATEAESLGYTHARMVEHYFEPYGGYSPNPIVFLSAVAARTRTMRLVTGAVLPVFNNPLKLAGEIAMLDGISKGRLDVGFARAFLLHEFRRFGISPDESRARYEEGITQIELLLTQEHATHRGQFHSFENTTSLPRPTQSPRPKFFVAANQTEETFAFAGAEGHAVMAIPLGPRLGTLLKVYRDAWRAAGHPGNGEVMVAFHMVAHEDGQRARDLAGPPFADYVRLMVAATSDWSSTQSKDYPNYAASAEQIKELNLDQQIANGAAWVGTPDDIKASIARITDMLGPFEHASLQVNFGMLPFDEAQRSMRLFAAEILPSL